MEYIRTLRNWWATFKLAIILWVPIKNDSKIKSSMSWWLYVWDSVIEILLQLLDWVLDFNWMNRRSYKIFQVEGDFLSFFCCGSGGCLADYCFRSSFDENKNLVILFLLWKSLGTGDKPFQRQNNELWPKKSKPSVVNECSFLKMCNFPATTKYQSMS